MQIVELLILGLTFLAVFILAQAGYRVFKKGVKQYEKKVASGTEKELDEMFVFVSAEKIAYFSILGVLVMAMMGYLLSHSLLICLAFGAVGFSLPRIYLRQLKKNRKKKFDAQLTEALTTVSNSLKAGLSLQQALDFLVKESEPPLSQEFSLVIRSTKLGVSMEEALERSGKRMPSEQMELVVTSINISRQLGGNLSEIFDRIANTIRERDKMHGKIGALTSQGKMQGLVVGLLPIGLGIIMYFLDPATMKIMFTSAIGWAFLATVIFLELIGGFLIYKIVNIDV